MQIKNQCSIYIKFGSKKIKLPVNPEELEIQHSTSHKKYDVLGKGEIVIPGEPSLKMVSWESLFPSSNGGILLNSGSKEPEYYVKLFERALTRKQICRLIITRSGLYDTNMRCIVSDFTTTDKGGEPEDVYYSVGLTEYRNYEPKTVSVMTISDGVSSESGQVEGEQERPVEVTVLRVGATVIANGRYWYDSYGSKPFGTANNLNTTITRIASGNAYPIHIGHYGWLREDQLQIIG